LTANELLALLGRAWPRLLIYPGGLAAFALVWLIGRTKLTEDRRSKIEDGHLRSSIFDPRSSIFNSWLTLSAIVLPWLGLALLPLPRVAAISRSTDLIAVLALLEWPLLLAFAADLYDCDLVVATRAQARLAAALNAYPPLILATLVLVSVAGSFDLAVLARAPDAATSFRAALLYWLGSAGWILALPPALGIGAFAAQSPSARALCIGLRLRAIGLVAVVALPWFALVAGRDERDFGGTGPSLLLLPLPPLVIAGLLWGFARLTAGHAARPWARAYLALDAVLLLLLLWAAYSALQARLA
jgi:hypothetical protein